MNYLITAWLTNRKVINYRRNEKTVYQAVALWY